MLKVIIIGTDNKNCRIGPSFDLSSWYSLKNFPVKNVSELPFKKGDSVEIKFEKEKINNKMENVLTEIKVVGSEEEPAKPGIIKYSDIVNTPITKVPNNNYDKERNEVIRKQSVGKMVPETLKAMDLTGLAIMDIVPIIQELFKTYDELTK